MKILILGDVMGNTGRKALEENFKKITTENKIDFTVVNGENAADDGKGVLVQGLYPVENDEFFKFDDEI